MANGSYRSIEGLWIGGYSGTAVVYVRTRSRRIVERNPRKKIPDTFRTRKTNHYNATKLDG